MFEFKSDEERVHKKAELNGDGRESRGSEAMMTATPESADRISACPRSRLGVRLAGNGLKDYDGCCFQKPMINPLQAVPSRWDDELYLTADG